MAGEEAFPLPLRFNLCEMAHKAEAVHLAQARRDVEHLVMTRRIDFPSRDSALRDKHIDPEPRDKMEACYLRAVHVVPRDLHLGRPLIQ
jgi:hypothetical protein